VLCIHVYNIVHYDILTHCNIVQCGPNNGLFLRSTLITLQRLVIARRVIRQKFQNFV